MKKSSIKNISEILQNSSLTRIVQKANFVNELNNKIQRKLPESFNGLYRVVNLVNNHLVFEVQNATVRQGLQLQQTALLNLIQIDFPEISSLEFKVNPDFKRF